MQPMGWAIDLDGVVWLGDEPIVGAAKAVRRLRGAGEQLAFVTNNSYWTRRDVAAKLARHDIDAADDVVTSAMAAAALIEPGEKVLACGGPGVVEAIESRGARLVAEGPADAVIVGYNPAFDYDQMRGAAVAVRNGARLIATNDDATYPTPDGPIPGAGSILASIVTASGVVASIAGKPHRPIADLVRAHLGVAAVVVGDRPDTDGLFARALQARFALVLTGVVTADDLPVEPEPDVIAADLAELVDRELGARA
jgi:HAD superfamily hydrolase (TIGR01450 family)